MNKSTALIHLSESVKLGSCYETAYKAIMSSKYKGWLLVHGIVLGTGGGARGLTYGHAWLEKGDICYDTETKKEIHRVLYYAIGNIEYTHKYTRDEAIEEALKFRHYGPWDRKIIALGR